jgi:hypothetical protein
MIRTIVLLLALLRALLLALLLVALALPLVLLVLLRVLLLVRVTKRSWRHTRAGNRRVLCPRTPLTILLCSLTPKSGRS